jgi:hypothetical protein
MKSQLVVSIYSDPGSLDKSLLRKWWGETEAWFIEIGVPPNEVSGRFKSKPKGLVGGNGYDLTRYRSRFAREIEAGNLEEIGLMRLPSMWKYKGVDWLFCADYGRFAEAFNLYMASIDTEWLTGESRLSSMGFAREVDHRSRLYLDRRYGFGVTMPSSFMPGGYALGVPSGELPEEMLWDANAWMHYRDEKPGCRECYRTIRNVFGYNVLNPRHLEIDVGGQRLRDWIEASGDRGRLEAQEDGLILWTFQEGDDGEAFLRWDYPPVVAVREQLKEYKIFPWQHLPGVE